MNRTVYFDHESMQSNSTPDPGHHMVKFSILCPGSGVLFETVTKTSYTREPRGQTFLNRRPQGCNISTVRSKAVVLSLLTFCLFLLPLWESVIVLCFVVRYLCPF